MVARPRDVPGREAANVEHRVSTPGAIVHLQLELEVLGEDGALAEGAAAPALGPPHIWMGGRRGSVPSSIRV